MPRHRVDDPADPLVSSFLGLRDHEARRVRESSGGDMAGTFMAEGQLVISRGLVAGLRLEAVLVDATRATVLEVPEEVEVLEAGPEVLEEVAGRPRLRDPIGRFERPPQKTLDDIVRRARTVVVTEAVNNANNMGVIARSAAALGADGLVLDSTSCDPLYRRAVRASMGEIFGLPHARVDDAGAALESMRHGGFTTVGLTPSEDAIDLGDLRFGREDRIALVVGSEGQGLSPELLAQVDVAARIPMARGVDSLNVAVAAAVACFAVEASRTRE